MSDAAMRVVVCAEPADNAALCAKAKAWADRLGLPCIDRARDFGGVDTADMVLWVTPSGLALEAVRGEPALTQGKPMRIELHKLDTTTGAGRSLRQPLLRAVGVRKGDPYRPRVLDATAGLGEDAWLLAGAGCRVVAVERHPVVAALVEDALDRARAIDPSTASRIDVVVNDSIALLAAIERGESGTAPLDAVDVVYIDPMFPPGRRTAERKPMRLLRALVGEDVDADALLLAALRVAARRVVVKRPRRAPPLGGAPASSHRGRGVRYDVHPSPQQGR